MAEVDGTDPFPALLERIGGGDETAMDELFRLAYDELRSLAAGQLGRERPGHTLQPTALVHELFLKISGASFEARDRGHFLSITARAMRQVLTDHARRRVAEKRGGGWTRTTLGGKELGVHLDPGELLDLDRAMEALDPRQRQVVELRFFGGLDEQEVAEVLGVTERTIRRDWVKARAWLYATLYPGGESGKGADPQDPGPWGRP